MTVQQKGVSAEEWIREKAAALQTDGAACLRGISRAERSAFERLRRQIVGSERISPAREAWRACLKEIGRLMTQPNCREPLPAQGGKPRIMYMAEWLWEADEAALEEAGFAQLVIVCGQAAALTYAEIWLLPAAMRLHVMRCFLTNTRALAENEAEESESIRELGRVRRMLALLNSMQWEKYLPQLSSPERLLMQDPGGVYTGLAESSRQQVRRIVQQIAQRGMASEEKTVQTALQMCGERHFPDITQVLLTDHGTDALQDLLGIPCWRRLRLHFDPQGRWILSATVTLTLLLYVLFAAFSGRFWIALAGLPVFWRIARNLFTRIAMAIVPPRPLPRMELMQIPADMRTLVVIPARVSGESELSARLDELQAYAAAVPEETVEYLLLADLPEAKNARMPGDDALQERARQCVEAMNRNAQHRRFHILWRERSYNEHDGIYQPRERKRGALMALYALLSGERSEFLPHSEAQTLREGNFRYVITLDAAAVPHPESFRQLVGAMAWPGNRFAVIQPCMHTAMRLKPTPFDRMTAPHAGTGPYSSAVGDLYQDMTGRGIYGGKGIVDIAAFRLALENRLPDNAVLSHDLIEGAFAGAGFAGDIAWLEYAPATLRGSLSRFERWTRGDWQLLPFLLDRDQPLDSLSRFQMTDNLLYPLAYVSAWLMLIGAAWTGSLLAAIVPLIYLALPLLLYPGQADSWQFRGLLCELCLLPVRAWTAASAIVRAVYRTYVSRERMLEWTPAEVAEGVGGVSRIPGGVSAVLLLPALANPAMGAAMIAIAGLFLLGVDWVRMQQQTVAEAELLPDDRKFLLELAGRTWQFFEQNVTEQTNYLPPDNVQLQPALGPVMRTSPTNIGMYLLSCLCANKLGIIDRERTEQRISQTLDTIERMPKWHGHLYNWHDVTTLQPVPPVAASSVDSGNLVGCLLCLSGADISESLRTRARKLAGETELSALYDDEKGLFHISADARTGECSAAHYDLFASESRILSLSAIAMRQVPVLHWRRLGRQAVRLEEGFAHISWSGTMFEYLMPDLLFSAPEQSAWYRSAKAVTDLQIAHAIDGLWGISESGHTDRDELQYYQYRAFGLDEVCGSGCAPGGVIAPYAAALALKYRRKEAIETLRRMAKRGYMLEQGLIEAIDFRMGEPQPVMSHMAHHQGMLLCAVTNALCKDYLCDIMNRLPEIRSVEPLLHENMGNPQQ